MLPDPGPVVERYELDASDDIIDDELDENEY